MKRATDQGKLWGANASDWSTLFEPMNEPLWRAMLESAAVSDGDAVLDLGCGGGGASTLLQRRGAAVFGLDAARELIEIARNRVPEGDFRVGDIDDLPYEDESFDIVFASLSLMFSEDIHSALKEVKRVIAPGGKLTVGIWGQPEDCEYRVVFEALRDFTGSSPGKGPFELSKRGLLENLLKEHRFEIIDDGEVPVPFRFESFEVMFRAIRSAGPIRSVLELVGKEESKSVMYSATKSFRGSNGDYVFRNRFRFVTAYG